ncbi:pyocin knob domain-containing protein, partial [Paenibacillus thailandensis]
MAYDPTDWKDRAVQRPLTYTMQDNGDGTITLIPAPGTVYEPGTAFSAALANKMEQGIADAQTPANILAWLKTVDGAGSGLDADTLDGIHASTFAQRTGDAFGGADLNNFTISGFYRLWDNLVNAPSGADYGQMLVVHGGGDTILQVVSGYSNGMISFRTGNPPNIGGTGSWSAWMNFYHTGKKPVILEGIYTSSDTAT